MAIPIRVPALESGDDPISVGTWLVDAGQHVESGDRLVELQLTGMVYVVSTDFSGIIEIIELQRGCRVEPGEVLAWIVKDPDA